MGKLICNKITDILCRLRNGKVTVKFSVVLNRKSLKGKAESYYQEYEYDSNKYIESPTMKSIVRDFSYSLTIQFPDKTYVNINPEHMLLLRRGLNKAVDWFVKDEYSKLFSIHNKILILNVHPDKAKLFDINIPVAFNKSIKIQPKVVTEKDGSVTSGVKISNGRHSFELNVSELFLLYYHVKELNMHQLASEMINSLKNDIYTGNTNCKKIESTFQQPDKPNLEQKSYGVASSRKKKPKDISEIF